MKSKMPRAHAPRSKPFIRKAIKHRGAFHRALGIPTDQHIPPVLTTTIANAPLGSTVLWRHRDQNRITMHGYRVTPKLKREAVLARTLNRVRPH